MSRYKPSKQAVRYDPCPQCKEPKGIKITVSLFSYGVRTHQSPCKNCKWLPFVPGLINRKKKEKRMTKEDIDQMQEAMRNSEPNE